MGVSETGRPHPRPCAECARCIQIVATIPALHAEKGHPPSLDEIGAALRPPLAGLGGVGYHIRALIAGGYVERRARYRGLYVARPLLPDPHIDAG